MPRSTTNLALRLLPVAAAAVVATGCAAPTPISAAPAAPSSSPAATSSPSAAPSSPSATSPEPSAAAPEKGAACRTADMSALIAAQPQAENVAMVQLTNDGPAACKVEGWASVSLINAADEVVDVRTQQVDQPGAPVAVVLKPGASAWAGIKWVSCAKSDSTCGAGNTLRFNLEASTDGKVAELEGFPKPERSAITMASLRIGTLQPIRQGVVAW